MRGRKIKARAKWAWENDTAVGNIWCDALKASHNVQEYSLEIARGCEALNTARQKSKGFWQVSSNLRGAGSKGEGAAGKRDSGRS